MMKKHIIALSFLLLSVPACAQTTETGPVAYGAFTEDNQLVVDENNPFNGAWQIQRLLGNPSSYDRLNIQKAMQELNETFTIQGKQARMHTGQICELEETGQQLLQDQSQAPQGGWQSLGLNSLPSNDAYYRVDFIGFQCPDDTLDMDTFYNVFIGNDGNLAMVNIHGTWAKIVKVTRPN